MSRCTANSIIKTEPFDGSLLIICYGNPPVEMSEKVGKNLLVRPLQVTSEDRGRGRSSVIRLIFAKDVPDNFQMVLRVYFEKPQSFFGIHLSYHSVLKIKIILERTPSLQASPGFCQLLVDCFFRYHGWRKNSGRRLEPSSRD